MVAIRGLIWEGKREGIGQLNRVYLCLIVFLSLFPLSSIGWCQAAGIPAPAYVYDGITPPDIDWTNSTTSLSANWAPITQYIDGYEIAVGTRPGSDDVVSWSIVIGNVTSYTISTPTLKHGTTYYVSVRGYLSVEKGEIASSDGVTVDTQAPSSQVNSLPPTQNSLTFTVSWSGTDDLSGIMNYDVQYRDGDTGNWVDWLTETLDTSAQFTGENGHTYYFRCRARDNAGNTEDWPLEPDTQTTIQVSGPPAPSYVNDGLTPPDIDWTNSTDTLSANWSAVSGAYGYEIAIGTTPTSTDVLNWTDVGGAPYTTRSGLTLRHGTTYYFLVRAYDTNHIAGKATASDGITVDTQAPSSQVNSLPPIQNSLTFTVSWSGTDDLSGIQNYDVQYRDGATGSWVDWQMATTNTSAQFTGENGHTYYFRCRARDNAGNTEDWPSAPDTQTAIQVSGPPAPSYVNDGLTPPDIDWTNSTDTLSANWSAVSGAYGYEIAIGTTPTSTDVLNWTDVGGAPYTTRSGLTLRHGTTYYFQVRAYDMNHIAGKATASDGITVDTRAPSSQVNPLPPTQNSLTFTVSWSGTDDLSGIQNYDVQYRDGATGSWVDWQMATTNTSASFTGENGHTYYFRCRARDIAGNLEDWPSAPDTQTTIQVSGPPAPSYVYDGLTPPDIDYTNSTDTLSANWSAVSGAYGYEIAIGTSPTSTDVLNWTDVGGATSTTRSGLTLRHGTTYYFLVRAYDANHIVGGATPSDGITVDTRAPSSQVNPLPSTENSLTFTVSWGGTDDLSGIMNYDVQYRDGATGSWVDWQMATTNTSAQFTGENGHTYYFRCRARDNAGNLEDWPSAPDTQTTIQVSGPPAPSYVYDGLTPPDIDWTNSTDTLSANWSAVSGAYGYEIAIGTTPTSTDVLNWTDVGNVTSTTRSGLTLRHGTTYYFLVRAYDANHIVGGATPSDGITVDTRAPSSQVNPLPSTENSLTFTVSWSGTDDLSGIMNYDVQYRDGATGSWVDWQVATTNTSAQFTGENGHTYYFRCRARDNAGNTEDWPSAPDTQTTINVGGVTLTVVANPASLTYSAGRIARM